MPPATPFLLALADMAGGLVALKLAELAREGELLLVRQRLVAKDEDGVPIHGGVNSRLYPRRVSCALQSTPTTSPANASGMGETTMGMGASSKQSPTIPQKFIAGGPIER